MTAAVKDVFRAADAPVDWIEKQAGLAALGEGNEVLPAGTLDAIQRHKVALKGPCTTPVGNTVDLDNGTYTNAIGDAQLAVLWEDPDFDPAQHAFYYARVLEIPTPRYSLLDSLALGIDPTETGRPATICGSVASAGTETPLIV